MRLLIRLSIFSSLLACGSVTEKVRIPTPIQVSTEPLPLASFREPGFALSQAKQQECLGLLGFFEDFSRLSMPGVDSKVSCVEVKDTIYTPEEIRELGFDEARCDRSWRCIKVRWELNKNNEKDVFFTLVIRFDDDNTRTITNGAYRNRSVLPRFPDEPVFASQLIDPGLASFLTTFEAWIGLN